MFTRGFHAKGAAAFGGMALAISVLMSGIAAAETPDRDGTTARFSFQKVSFPTDPRFTQLLGINDHNVIAGYHGMTINKGFTLRLPNHFADENFPNSAQTQVVGINNSDDTVGFYIDQQGNTHGFEKKHNKDFVTVDLPGTTFNQLLGINDEDQAAGYFQDAAGVQHAYVHEKDGDFLVLSLTMPSSQATSINDRGTIVGFEQSSPAAATSSGFILKHHQLTVLNFPGSTFTQAFGINNSDDIVGAYNDANGNTHGFLFADGRFESIDVPGAASTVINGINEYDRVVGFFVDTSTPANTIGVVGEPER